MLSVVQGWIVIDWLAAILSLCVAVPSGVFVLQHYRALAPQNKFRRDFRSKLFLVIFLSSTCGVLSNVIKAVAFDGIGMFFHRSFEAACVILFGFIFFMMVSFWVLGYVSIFRISRRAAAKIRISRLSLAYFAGSVGLFFLIAALYLTNVISDIVAYGIYLAYLVVVIALLCGTVVVYGMKMQKALRSNSRLLAGAKSSPRASRSLELARPAAGAVTAPTKDVDPEEAPTASALDGAVEDGKIDDGLHSAGAVAADRAPPSEEKSALHRRVTFLTRWLSFVFFLFDVALCGLSVAELANLAQDQQYVLYMIYIVMYVIPLSVLLIWFRRSPLELRRAAMRSAPLLS